MTQTTPHVFPFHAPHPRMSNWDTELFISDNFALLMPGQESMADNLDSILPDPSVPVLAFTGTLYQELRYIARTVPETEWAVFLTLKRLSETKPHFLAFDWFMPGQQVNGTAVSMNVPDTQRYYESLKEVDYYRENGLHQHLCHLHSHGSMSAFFSPTDDEQQFTRSELGFYGSFRFYVVVNAKGAIKVSLVNYDPVLFRTDVVAALMFSRPEYAQPLTAERKAEIDQVVRDALVRSPVARPGKTEFSPAGNSPQKRRAAKAGAPSPASPKNNGATMAEVLSRLLRYLIAEGPCMEQPGQEDIPEPDMHGFPLWESRLELGDDPDFANVVKSVCRRLPEAGLKEYEVADFLSVCILMHEGKVCCWEEDLARESALYLKALATVLIQASQGVRMSHQDIKKFTKNTFLSPATVMAAQNTGANVGHDALYQAVREDFDMLLAGQRPQAKENFGLAFPR